MRCSPALAVLVALSFSAWKAAAAPIDFIGFDPAGPLARVAQGRIASPSESACRTWAKKGSSWKALDRLGRVVGRARVRDLWRYDLTNCDELTFETTTGKNGAGIFVRGPYEPLAIAEWRPSAAARRQLMRLIARRDASIRRMPEASHEAKEFSFDKRTIAFRVPGHAPRVIVGGRALTLLRWNKGRFEVEHQQGFDLMGSPNIQEQCEFSYKPIAVADMNGDGSPEVVVHEHTCDVYADFTLTRDRGKWRTVLAGISGGYA
jgi:hypothetical protein